MKIVKSALLAAGLAALAACGGSEEAVVNAPAEDVNVAADDLGADENLLGNEGLGNESDANAVGNDAAGNEAGNGQ